MTACLRPRQDYYYVMCSATQQLENLIVHFNCARRDGQEIKIEVI